MDTDFSNAQFVGAQGDNITVMMPKLIMSANEAMVHAAWLVTISAIRATISWEDAIEGVQK